MSLLLLTAILSVNASAQTTVVVNQTSITGWVFYDDETDKIDPTLGSFVTGPGTAPLGTGSAQISVSGSQRRNLATYQFSGTVLSTITELKYSTYNPSAGNGGSANRSGYLHFNVDFNGSDTFQRRLVFVPSNNGAVIQNTWQEWDAINGGAALWSYSGPTWPITGQPGTFLKTWAQILSDYPGVRIRVTDAFVGIRVGEPYPDGYTENIDAFKFGTGAGTTQFDFDPATAPLSVSPTGAPNPFDNDYTRINNAVQAIANGGTITLSGTFNWTEPFAAASWAQGSDGQTGTVAFDNDNYSVLPRAGLNSVTVTAASLGAATIQGPGDLPLANLEGVLQFYSGGANQNWTISNLRFLDFDNAIGFYFAGGPSTIYNGTQILNNYILIARDLNTVVAPVDTNQNIGIHFSFGSGQTISGNTIDFAGDGVSNGVNFSSEVGMQSNTSGGSVYEGLVISNNTLRVVNAQSATPESILGIWENGHAHTSNITISGNSFTNLAGGNNPALNLQRGFRVTSHSSATTTVTYSNNLVSAANIGFQWITGSNFTGNLPVRVTSNTLLNNGTGVLVQSQGLANLSFNRIVGNATGVNNIDGTVTAENNWWGCNYGPGLGGAGCSGTANGITGAVDANPWLTLTTAAVPSSILTGGSSTVTSKLTINSDAVDTSGSGSVPNITPVNFAGTLGTVAPPSSTTTAGVATTLFTAGIAAGSGNVATMVDAQTVNAPISIAFSCNNVSIPTGTMVAINTQFVVPINVDDTTGRGILGYAFTLTYNPAVVTPIAVETTGTLSNGWAVTSNNSSGAIVVSGFNTIPLSGSGTLVNVRFISIGGIGTTSNLNLTSFVFNEGVPCVNTTNGNVTIISGTMSGAVTYANAPVTTPVPNTTINAAGSIPLSTTTDANGLYSLSGFGAGAYTVTPSHANQVSPANGFSSLDASRIAQHVVGFITLNATQLIAADVSGNGTVSPLDAAYVAQFIVGIPNPSVTGTWKFLPPSRSYPDVQSNQANQDYSAILMGDVTGNWNPAGAPRQSLTEAEDQKRQQLERSLQVVTVTAPTQFAQSGANFTVSLSTTDTTGENILGYTFDLVYNENVIFPQVNPCDVTGTVSSLMSATCNAATPGLLKVTVFGTMPATGAGILLKLKFNAVGSVGNMSPLTIQNFVFNEGAPLDVTTDGQVTLFAPTAAGAEVGGKLMTYLGQPVPNTRVTMVDTNGERRTTISTSLGFYRFYDVQVGQTYVVTVESKRFTFTPQAVTVGQDLTTLDLIADQ